MLKDRFKHGIGKMSHKYACKKRNSPSN